MDRVEEFRKERDTIISEIGEFSYDDFVKSGITMEEYSNPNEDVIQRLIDYIRKEYNQTSVFNDIDA